VTRGIEPVTLAETARSLGRPGEQLLLVEKRQEITTVRVKRGQLEAAERGHEHVQAVRVIAGRQFGHQTSRAAAWSDLVDAARANAADGVVADWPLSDLAPMGKTAVEARESPDPGWLCGLAAQLDATLADMHHGLAPQVQIRWVGEEDGMADGEGRERHWVRGEAQIAVSGRIVEEGDFLTVGDHAVTTGDVPPIDALLASVRTRLEWSRVVVDLPPGRYPIMLRPSVVLSILSPALARLSGPAVASRTSPWAERLGAAVLNEAITLSSDPIRSDGPRSVPWDDEGTPTETVAFIEHGLLRDFTWDRRTAHEMGATARGTAFSGEWGALPTPRPANLVMAGGDAEEEGMLRAFPRLLILEGWIGARPVNPLRGEIAGTVTGLYLVEQGVVQGRIKNAVVSLDAFDALQSRLVALSRDRRWVGGGMMQVAPALLPSVLVEGAAVAHKAGGAG
jgi:PmbA protein